MEKKENEKTNEENIIPYKPKNTGKIVGIIIAVLVLVIALVVLLIVLLGGSKKESGSNNDNNNNNGNESSDSVYKLSNDEVSNFDLAFLKLENKEENKIYSPLSIKYALLMLKEGAKGDSKKQISSVVGDYEPQTYVNSSHKSFANALFVRDDYKSSIEEKYINVLKKDYNAEVMYDSFESPNTLNNWVSNKTFKLIDNLFDDIRDNTFILVNALAIDMEWNNKIQSENQGYDVNFKHEKFNAYVSPLSGSGYTPMDFNNMSNRNSVQIAAVANKYDIIKELGEENIRKEVTDAYNKWVNEGAYNSCDDPEPVSKYIENYMKDIKENYGHISSSTDFLFYDDEDIKVFAKDLKEYDGSVLQYVGIMPKNVSLKNYVEKINEKDLNKIIGNLKDISLDNFDDKTITYIKGNIPLFNFEYDLNLIEDLNKLGITDVFDSSKANLTGITSEEHAFIGSAAHKANIEFSNDGIKAAAATQIGGLGGIDCGFEYDFDVPIKEIDLTFDNPYMFLIRDKESGEIWFVGTVYEPSEYQAPRYW